MSEVPLYGGSSGGGAVRAKYHVVTTLHREALPVFECVGTGSVVTEDLNEDTQRPRVVLCSCLAKVAGQKREYGCWSEMGVSRAHAVWWCPAA